MDNKAQREYGPGTPTRDNDVTEKEDRKKPKMNFAFQRLALEHKTREEAREENKFN